MQWTKRIVPILLLTSCFVIGAGDLAAIQESFNRLEGKPSQKIVGPDNGPLQVEYRTIEEVRMFLLERGIVMGRLA